MGRVSVDNNGKLKPKKKPRGKPNPQNLVPFKPGESGNPGGRPRGEKLETTISRYMERDAEEVAKLAAIAISTPEALKGISFQDALVIRTLGAFYNDPSGSFFAVIRETKEGKLTDTVKHEGAMGIVGITSDLANKTDTQVKHDLNVFANIAARLAGGVDGGARAAAGDDPKGKDGPEDHA
jgi:hypothetical protein